VRPGELVKVREIGNKQMTDRLTVARGNCDVVKDGAGDRPPTNDFTGSCHGLSQDARLVTHGRA